MIRPAARRPQFALLFSALLLACNGTAKQEVGTTSASTIQLELPGQMGQLDRPPVPFDHAQHVKAVGAQECQRCHVKDDEGRLVPLFARAGDDMSRDALMKLYHDRCMGCHQQARDEGKQGGPLTCGECHQAPPTPRPERIAMALDASLHARHVAAVESCGSCHHIYDEAGDELVYVKGKEEPCRSCHKAEPVARRGRPGKVRSIASAAHLSCVSCHLSRQQAKQPTGPVNCDGCHATASRAGIARLEEIPRLKREQPDQTWIHTAGATSGMVPFDHQGHEENATSCRVCHHETLQACDSCHTLRGAPEGEWIALETAAHHPTSRHSCVGCHRQTAAEPGCAGCHHTMAAAPSERSCTICHQGPTSGEPPASMPADFPAPPELEPLPRVSKEFPDEVTIAVLSDAYEPSKLPHRKIVAALDAQVRKSDLARTFHGSTAALCAGCHHHSPIGKRPPACASCHAKAGHATRDKPGLLAAYHRQCIGCHVQMGIEQQGCTDCHAQKTSKEVAK